MLGMFLILVGLIYFQVEDMLVVYGLIMYKHRLELIKAVLLEEYGEMTVHMLILLAIILILRATPLDGGFSYMRHILNQHPLRGTKSKQPSTVVGSTLLLGEKLKLIRMVLGSI